MLVKKMKAALIALAALAAFPLATAQPAFAGSYGQVTIGPGTIPSYSSSTTFFTAPTGATTIFWGMVGSASKTVYIQQIAISRQSAGTGADQYVVNKRTSATTGGTGSSVAIIPLDSNNASSGATVTAYTAAPTAGGGGGQVGAGITAQGAVASNLVLYQAPLSSQGLTLRGTSECVELEALTTLGGSTEVTVQFLAR